MLGRHGKRVRVGIVGALAGSMMLALSAVAIQTRARPVASSTRAGQHLAFGAFASPIAGMLVSAKRQAILYSGSIPLLPVAAVVDDVCGNEVEQVDLRASWVSVPSADGRSEQLAMNFSGGIWMAVSPLSFFTGTIRKSENLPPVAEFFTDESVSLRTGEVRGHTAWIKDLSKDFDCTAVAPVDQDHGDTNGEMSPGPRVGIAEPSPVDADTVMYATSQTADVSWKERGVVIELVGPYPASFLESLAEGITWSRNTT